MSANEPLPEAEPVEAEVETTAPVEVEPPEPPDWRRRETLGSALVQIAVAAVLLSGLVSWRYHRATVRIADAEQVQAARELARSDSPEDLLAALKGLEPAAARGVREANALSARVHLELWRTHGLAEHEAPAREQLERAEQADAANEDRYAARGLLLLVDGKAAEAEALYREVERRGGQSPWLSHVLGRARQARGDFREAAAEYQRAVEAGWREPGLLASCGEGLLELGRDEEAARAFAGALGRESGHVRSLAGLALAKLFAGEAPTLAEKAVEAALARREALTPGLKARALAAAAELERQASELEGSGAKAKPGDARDSSGPGGAREEGGAQRRSPKLEEARRDAEAAAAARPNDVIPALVRARVLLTARDPAAGRALADAAKAYPFAPAIALTGALAGADGLAVLDAYAARFAAQLPSDQAYWLARGDVLRALGRTAEATAAYESARALGGRGAAKASAALARP